MSVESIAKVLNHSRASGTTKLVLIGIANHDGDGGAWPSIATLARYANASERTVQRAIEELVERGEVVVHRNDGGTHTTRADRRPNRYEITVEQHLVEPVDNVDNGVTPLSPRKPDGVTTVTPRGDRGDADGVTRVSPEPSLEPSMKNEGSPRVTNSPAEPVDNPPLERSPGRPRPLERPDRCPQHQLDENPPPCGPCKTARLQHENTLRDAARQDAERRRKQRARINELRRADIQNCGLCDDTGYAGTRVCSHDPTQDQVNSEGAARARAVLSG